MARHNNDKLQLVKVSRMTNSEKLLYVLIVIELIDVIVSFVR
jgi:hypothetical protein